MNKRLYTVLLCAVILLTATLAKAITITRIEPANWWVGMKNTELQIMVYGPDIGKSTLTINYQGIKLKELAKTTNPNFIYLSISKGTKSGLVSLIFTGRIKDNRTVLVILNGAVTDQTLEMNRFTDITERHTNGSDVITSKAVVIRNTINIPAKGVYILELSKINNESNTWRMIGAALLI